MKIGKATKVPFSSVVGSSVMLLAPEGNCIATLALLNVFTYSRKLSNIRDVNDELAKFVADAINEKIEREGRNDATKEK